jgi:hypothetical protein
MNRALDISNRRETEQFLGSGPTQYHLAAAHQKRSRERTSLPHLSVLFISVILRSDAPFSPFPRFENPNNESRRLTSAIVARPQQFLGRRRSILIKEKSKAFS